MIPHFSERENTTDLKLRGGYFEPHGYMVTRERLTPSQPQMSSNKATSDWHTSQTAHTEKWPGFPCHTGRESARWVVKGWE